MGSRAAPGDFCGYVAMRPKEMAGVAWVQRDGVLLYWNGDTEKFEFAEGPLLPEGWRFDDGSR